ncbi:MAG: DUF1294 domain-containing protein [Candidatus Magasanikbacteria bacterium]
MFIEYFLNLPIPIIFLTIYLIIINIVTFFYFGFDKLKSRKQERRVSEKKLWTLCLIGGSVGGLAGMKYFRHKTKKISFQAILVIIIALQIGGIFALINSLS